MKSQVRAASRKWFARALLFLERSKGSVQLGEAYLKRFRRQEKLGFAISCVLAAKAVAR